MNSLERSLPPTGHGPLDAFAARQFLLERDAYTSFLELICAEIDSTVGYLHLYDESSETLALNVWTGDVQSRCRTATDGHYPLQRAGIWADCIRKRAVQVHNDYPLQASRNLPEGHVSLHNHASFPVWEGQRIAAVLGIGDVLGGFDEQRVDHIERMLRLGWPVLQDRLLNVRMRRLADLEHYSHVSPYTVLRGMVRAISSALELRDAYTAHHQQNVAFLSERIARAVGLTEFECTGVEFGAALHDIGKLALPSSLLAKPGAVSPVELQQLQTHSEVGAGLLKHLELPWPLKDMIEQHHERLDGSGYPAGLARADICEGARIIAIADTYDAMSSDRPYRRARGTRAALAALEEGSGALFDSYLVNAFLRVAGDDPTFEGRYAA